MDNLLGDFHRIGLVDVVVFGGTMIFLGSFGLYGQELLGGENLGDRVFELVVHQFHAVVLFAAKTTHDIVTHRRDGVKGGGVKNIVVTFFHETSLFGKEFCSAFTDGNHR